MKISYSRWLLVLCFVFPCITAGQDTPLHLDVPYVPTPEEVVEVMLDITHVNENDILYDLGCGDGRIVITAAKEKGARGVGIDINPKRIEESIKNAEKANVMDRVQFIEGDLFLADFSEATVLTMYLLPAVNIRLRPRLLRELMPGSRIVSHDFSMNEWEPDSTIKIPNDFHTHSVYFWIIPANVTGKWEGDISLESGDVYFILELIQQFQEVAGTITIDNSKMSIREVALAGDRLQFRVERTGQGDLDTIIFDGKVNGNTLSGIIRSESGSSGPTREWTANRDPSTISSIDQ
ncbi:methyltransferase domain-containing protein [bacterium]|nr:methyltransferase domain-containing protein [bacterium]RQV97810.1 MAG: SAM-dependent methyltransferase [bacterium]